MCDSKHARLSRFLFAALTTAALISGCMPYELRTVLDGEDGKALALSPSATVVPANNMVSFKASGGVAPYKFSVVTPGGGLINPTTGAYTAPITAGSAVIRVTDKTGKFIDAVVTIQAFSTGLAISPGSISLSIGSNLTFTAIGGTPPYSFAIPTPGSGTPGISPTSASTALYVAGSTPDTTDVVSLTDSATPIPTTVTATVTVTPLTSVDYTVPATTFAASGTVGAAIPGGQSFTLHNNGTADGTQPVDWKVYLSVNLTLDGGDTVIASGTKPALTAGTSSPVGLTVGTFPAVPPGPYYLIAEVSSADDTTPLNNSSAASPLTLNPLNIDYIVQSVSNTGGTVAGTAMTGAFTMHNSGGAGGTATVYFDAYASADAVLDGSDYLLMRGSRPALGAGGTLASIPFSGNWPSTPGTWRLIVTVSATDDIDHANDATASGSVVTTGPIPADVDYVVVSVLNTGGATAGDPIAATFTYRNNGGDDGGQTVYWTAYLSSNNTLQLGTDPVIDSGSGSPGSLGAGITSTSVPITGTWPAAPGTWYLIVSVSSSDDVDSTNNSTSSGSTVITAPNVDYSVVSLVITGTVVAGDPITGTFAYSNGGTHDGNQSVPWTVYLSANPTLEIGTDPVIDSGVAGRLDAGDSSGSIGFGGRWPAVPGTWYVIVSVSASDDTVPGNNATPNGPTATPAPDVNYTVLTVNNTGGTTAGSPLAGNFTLKNIGAHAGTQFVPWRAYISTNSTLEIGTDLLIDSGFLVSPGLAAGATSSSIGFAGTWPGAAVVRTYYLIIEAGAGDDVAAGNNAGASALVTVNPPDVNYSVNVVNNTGPTITSSGLSGNFTIHNNGASNGGAPITWTAHISSDPALQVTDPVIATSSTGQLPAFGNSASIPFLGTWPATAGTWYLIVEVSASDDTNPANNWTSSIAIVVTDPPKPDYTASFNLAIPWSGLIGESMSAHGTTQITIQNVSVNLGHANITWAVYLSLDNVLDGTDTLVQQGTIGPLAGSSSTPQAFAGNWPAAPGNLYFLIARVQATDDSNLSNDVVPAPHACAIGDYRYVEAAENNGGNGPQPPVGQTSNMGVGSLGGNQTIAIEGVMDIFNEYDTYRFTTIASMSRLSMRAMWGTGYDDIDLFLWSTVLLDDFGSVEVGVNSEPGAGTFDLTAVTPRTCYISANFWLANNTSSSTGQKYVILVRALP
jgi:hypothetical protein